MDGRTAGAPTNGLPCPGETVSLEVTVTPAHISAPLNPAERNQEDDLVDLWVGASAVNGIPVNDELELSVAPVIVVDPGLENDGLELTEADVRAARYGIGYDALVPMDLEVRHNLINDVNELVNALWPCPTFASRPTVAQVDSQKVPAGPSRPHR